MDMHNENIFSSLKGIIYYSSWRKDREGYQCYRNS